MHKTESVENLVDEEPNMVLGEHHLGLDNVGEVALHELHDQVHLVEGLHIVDPDDLQQRYYIFMAEKLCINSYLLRMCSSRSIRLASIRL